MTQQGDQSAFEPSASLRQASDAFLQRLDRLLELETRKRELNPTAPEFIRLAREIEDLSRALLAASGRQLELAEDVQSDVKAGEPVDPLPIREAPPRRDAVSVLTEWRSAERRLAAASPGSRDEAEARADVERLRAEYRRVTAPEMQGDRGG